LIDYDKVAITFIKGKKMLQKRSHNDVSLQ